jgi:hypothetical protein
MKIVPTPFIHYTKVERKIRDFTQFFNLYIYQLLSYMYRAAFIILYYDQQMRNCLTNYHTP